MNAPGGERSAAGAAGIRVTDLIITKGPIGHESIVVPGLTAHVQAGEVVAVRCLTRDVAAVLMETLNGRRQAQYGLISAGARTSRRIAPRTPKRLVIVELDGIDSLDPNCRAIVVDASRAPVGASISSLHQLASGGAAVMLVTADEQLAAAADRQVEVEPRAGSDIQDPVIGLADLTEPLGRCPGGPHRGAKRVVGFVILAAAVSGCGSPSQHMEAVPENGVLCPPVSDRSDPSYLENGGSVPSRYFRTQTVVWCSGFWDDPHVRYEQLETTNNVAPWVPALRTGKPWGADERGPCPAAIEPPEIIFLVDSNDQALRVETRDSCNMVRADVKALLKDPSSGFSQSSTQPR